MDNLPIINKNELATSSQAAQAMAEIQAAYAMAMHNPRRYDKVRDRLLDNCMRPGFAGISRYCRKVGYDYKKKEDVYAEGWSIRTAEVVHTNYGNLKVTCQVLFDDDSIRKIACTAVDLETNASQTLESVVKKVVERKKPGERKPLYERKNSYGEMVYGLPAYDSEVDLMAKAERSKLKRDVIMALVPGDLLDEMLLQVNETLANADQVDPISTRKKIVDQFRMINVDTDALISITSKVVNEWGPSEFALLRKVYGSVKTGEVHISHFIPVDVKPEPKTASLNLGDMRPGPPETHTEPGEVQAPKSPQQDPDPVTASGIWMDFVSKALDHGSTPEDLKELEKTVCKTFKVTKVARISGDNLRNFQDWLADTEVTTREPGEDD
jgi:hypothetical protein